MGLIVNQLSKAVLSAINGTPIRLGFIPHMLRDLTKLGTHPVCLTEAAYTWCSVVYENRQSLGNWESLLPVCLEIGFRHLDFQYLFTEARIAHTEHRGLIDVVFKTQESEVIADLLHAWGRIGQLLCRTPCWSSKPGSVLLKVAAARHTLRPVHRLRGIREGRSGESHWIAEPSPRYNTGC